MNRIVNALVLFAQFAFIDITAQIFRDGPHDTFSMQNEQSRKLAHKSENNDDLYFDVAKNKKHSERSFEEEIGETHTEEDEATHFSAHNEKDHHGPNLIKRRYREESTLSSTYISDSTSTSSSSSKFEKVLPHQHPDLGIDKVHAHKIVHKVDLSDDEFGKAVGLRSPDNIEPVSTAPCIKREEDGLFACLPDVYWIGVSAHS
jgi:hypothetical protein